MTRRQKIRLFFALTLLMPVWIAYGLMLLVFPITLMAMILGVLHFIGTHVHLKIADLTEKEREDSLLEIKAGIIMSLIFIAVPYAAARDFVMTGKLY